MKTKFFLAAVLFAFLSASATLDKKHPLLKINALQDFVEVPGGEVSLESEKYRVEGFFISKYEVTNLQYQEFLQDLKEKGEEEALSTAQIKNENWQKVKAAGKLEELYHTYSGFAHFPVVNVSYEGAQRYCQWLTEKVKSQIRSNQEVEFRLPTRQEWVRAARGETSQTYAWNSPYLRNAEGKFQCNFKKLSAELIHFNEQNNTYEIVAKEDGPLGPIFDKVGTYSPNAFGVYNLCGNAAEMIAEEGKAVGGSFNSSGYDVRVESIEAYQDASPLVGFRPIMVLKNK